MAVAILAQDSELCLLLVSGPEPSRAASCCDFEPRSFAAMAPKMGGLPSIEVMADWIETDSSLQVVATWAGVADKVLGEFCAAVGTTPQEPLINVSYFSPEEATGDR